ncbi:MAG TPA: DUF192 domain-containing protein [Sphingomonas sp.]|jgi:hypothetical protein|nr:DUF192 domain-containing protein [Sphingomonas sp.]
MKTLALALLLATTACGSASGTAGDCTAATDTTPAVCPLTVNGAKGAHVFKVEMARTAAQQQQGLMYRTDLTPDGGMLFWPYPPEGGAPKEANFWMKNTPTSLDIVFIRTDGTIARIAENTVPFSEGIVPSGEPVAAVLELIGGRTAALGIREGDKVVLPKS